MPCVRRFIGRRGLPKLIVSGNVKTFQASEKTLVSLFELEDVQEHLSRKGIRWQFNLAKAPWWVDFLSAWWNEWNPVWRKHSEDRSFHLTNSQLFLSKLKQFRIQALYSDDVEEPLTPSHLIIGRRLLTLPVGPLQIDDWDFGDHITATKRSRYLADRIQHFRRRQQ